MNTIKALWHAANLYCLVQNKLFQWTGFYSIPSQFSYICIFIVAVPRQSETMNRLKCLTNSLKCQPAKVFDCLIAKDNWISLSESILIMRWTITRAGGSLAVSLALHLRSLHIYQCNFPFHELLQLLLNSSYLKIKLTKGINSLSIFLPLCLSVHLPEW